MSESEEYKGSNSLIRTVLESEGGMNGNVGGAGGVDTIFRKKPWIMRCFTKKPLEVVHAEEDEGVLERTLGFWDLFALGFGGTVGSGVFVMTGLMCHEMAGPAAFMSWVIAGFGCLLSAMSFAELSWRVPSAGGAYAYTFVALGELPAAIVGWCLTLEYGVSGAAVAKSWGEMLSVGITHVGGGNDETDSRQYLSEERLTAVFGGVLDMGGVYAALLQAVCVVIVLGGLKTSTITVNVFSCAKAIIVVFMVSAAFSLYDIDNFVPLAPFGVSGVLKGSVAAFFGFLGFDEVVLLSPEAKNPMKHVPRALFSSLFAVALVCALASVSLSGASPASELDPDSAFAEAFRQRGMMTAYGITAIGELITLPLVVLVSFMAQPRLLFAMAKDGLLPHIFAEVDSRGTLLKGALLSGAVFVVTAALVPFDSLNDIISAGALLAFNLVTSSLLVLRHRSCVEDPLSATHSHTDAPVLQDHANGNSNKGKTAVVRVLSANIAACTSAGLAIVAENTQDEAAIVAAVFAALCGVVVLCILSHLQAHPKDGRDTVGGNFLSPFFPWPQAIALWVNWFLVFNLPTSGILTLLAFVTIAIGHYVCFGAANSVGNCSGWASLLSNAAARTGKRGCMSLSATHDLESDVSVGIPSCLSPSAGAPLLEDRGDPVNNGEWDETLPAMGSAAGRGDTDIVRTNSESTTPGTAVIIEQQLRRRSSEVSR